MGFPVDYTDVFVPKIFIHIIFLLGYVRTTVDSLFHFLGLSNLLEQPAESTHHQLYYFHEPPTQLPAATQLFNVLIKEYLPAAIFSEDDGRSEAAREMCVVCLYGIEDGEEIRWLKNCKHVFHRSCIDRWMDYNQRSCPLCRTGMVPHQQEDEFNRRLWGENDDTGGGDFDGDNNYYQEESYSYLL